MADAVAQRPAPMVTRRRAGPVIALLAVAVAACNNSPFFTGASDDDPAPAAASTAPSTTSASSVNHMSTAAAIRDRACYSDFELTTAAIEAKLEESIRNISVSGDVGENALRDEMILGLRFNANLQKRLAFDTLEECLR